MNIPSNLQLVIFDVDGVLTDGRLFFNDLGESHKVFHVHDGHGIKMLMSRGIEVAIISGRESAMVSQRMQELGVQHVYQGQSDKIPVFEALLEQLNIKPEQVAYLGDDLPDLAVMHRVGFSVAVANAVPEVASKADWQTSKAGGQGAVREFCDAVLAAQAEPMLT